VESIGLDTIVARSMQLTNLLRSEAAKIDRVRIITPLDEGKSAGITSLMFDGFTHQEMNRLVDWLYSQHKVHVKAQWLTAPPDPVKIAMRISIASFNTEDEVGGLVEGLMGGLNVVTRRARS
jgi:selenocysteine lyase/cysteine desulfurase